MNVFERILNPATLVRQKSFFFWATKQREIARHHDVVVIDEIQKIPALLDEVHHLIESEDFAFFLTGSSARNLRHGGVNLLAGQAWPSELFPLTSAEIP